MLATADVLFAKGLLTPPAHFDFVLGVPGAAAATAENLTHFARSIPAGCTWTVAGIGRRQTAMATMAIAMGGHVRVGFEDNIYYRKGELADSNARFVERVVRIAREVGREPRLDRTGAPDPAHAADVRRVSAASGRTRTAGGSSSAGSSLWDTSLLVLGLVDRRRHLSHPREHREGGPERGLDPRPLGRGRTPRHRRRPRVRRDGRHDAEGRRHVRLFPRGLRGAAGLPLRVGRLLGDPHRLGRRRGGRVRPVLLGVLPVALERERRPRPSAARDQRRAARRRGPRRSSSRRPTTSACARAPASRASSPP